MTASLPPVTAVVLATVLTGVAMALVVVAGFGLASRQELRRAELDIG